MNRFQIVDGRRIDVGTRFEIFRTLSVNKAGGGYERGDVDGNRRVLALLLFQELDIEVGVSE